MWFSVTLWAVLASLICSTIASSSHHSGFPDYEAGHKTGFADPRWTLDDYERDIQGKNGGPWSADDETLSRQMFDEKTSDAADALLADLPKEKRESHSLSIVNPLDVLRQRLMLEMARRRMKENQEQIRENALILKNLGKRSAEDNKGGLDARTKQDYLRRIHVSNSEEFEV